jgi:hypothetical protein
LAAIKASAHAWAIGRTVVDPVIVSRPFEVPVRALGALLFIAEVVSAPATVGMVVAAGEAVGVGVGAGVLLTQPLTSSATIRSAASPQATIPEVLRFSAMILFSQIISRIYTVIRQRLYIYQ